jgi:sensor domain CHASE-containing protein
VVQAARYSGRKGGRIIIVKLVDRLRVFTGIVLLALALILGGCGGNEAQEEQQDVQEEQEDVQEAQEDLEQEQKDVEEEQQDVEQEKQEIKEEQQDEEK